jgi:heme/copper-type cytochrome/quinol oxidase subunit 2
MSLNTQSLSSKNERRNIEFNNGIVIEQDKRSRQYIIWSNIVYLITVFGAIGYIVLLFKEKKTAPKKYIYKYRNEIYFLIIISIYMSLTAVNSMYYHDCGGSLNKTNMACHLFDGLGYDFSIVNKNDLLFSGLSILITTLLIPRKFNGRTFKFFLVLLTNIYMISVLSFTKLKNNFIYSNIIFAITAIICFYYGIKELYNSEKNITKTYKIIVLILLLVFTVIAFTVFSYKKHNIEINEIINKTNGNLTNNEIQKIKENIRKDNVLHGTWHIMGALSSFCVIIYKIIDIKKFTISK